MTDGRNFSSCYTYLQGFLSPPVGPLTVCLDFVNENKKENKNDIKKKSKHNYVVTAAFYTFSGRW